MPLEKHIASLLKQHNCVIVPDFGGFIANYESAWINRSRAAIYPPFKQVLFNANLQQNDGLLANELVVKTAVSYVDALAQIATQVKDWRKELEAGHRIELGEIGFLFMQQNQVVFEQNREVNLLLQAYGLKQVTFVDYAQQAIVHKAVEVKETLKTIEKKPVEVIAEKAVPVVKKSVVEKAKTEPVAEKQTPVIALNVEEKIEAVEVASEDPKVIPIQPKTKKARNYKYAVAAAVVLPALFYAYWIPMKTDFLNTGKVQLSDFNPLNTQSKSTYEHRDSVMNIDLNADWKSWEELTGELPAHVAVYNLELTEDLYIPVRLEGVEDLNTFNADAPYHVVAGCFSVEANAQNLVNQLTEKGYQAGIVDKHKGLFRVSAGAFQAESEVENAKDQLEKDGFSGWILKK